MHTAETYSSFKMSPVDLYRLERDSLRDVIERCAEIVFRVIDPILEDAGSVRKWTSRECNAAEEALWQLQQALRNLESHRVGKSNA